MSTLFIPVPSACATDHRTRQCYYDRNKEGLVVLLDQINWKEQVASNKGSLGSDPRFITVWCKWNPVRENTLDVIRLYGKDLDTYQRLSDTDRAKCQWRFIKEGPHYLDPVYLGLIPPTRS